VKTLSRFVAKFTNLIGAVFSCFDRVIFKSHCANQIKTSSLALFCISLGGALADSRNPSSELAGDLPREVSATRIDASPEGGLPKGVENCCFTPGREWCGRSANQSRNSHRVPPSPRGGFDFRSSS